ncbi:Oxidation resistance protein 1 [Gracilariopsis chorda]|uniref:Oxidation resistance protein 1 n=1 Tax=Gracilariopsis chorda TaxID=448386 RepID=A0A2V3IMK5_9FLOR|nr:Oxidation resistance protein 1 [Gracilariopsis chorda]|eukprot:PXF43315.1 Oxidation resistance protein 1 [Gracilariopsis chorda]
MASSSSTTLKHDFESLSQEASSLAASLARRRADIALMRAEAATIAVALEAAKEQLDDLLRDESAIRSSAPRSAMRSTLRADFLPDQGLVKALKGQLEVTQEWLKTAIEKRSSLKQQLKELHASQSPSTSNANVPSPLEVPSSPSATASNEKSPQRTFRSDIVRSQPRRVQSVDSHLSKTPSAAMTLLTTLKQDAEAQTTFRQDHARIWRDITMPNLALILRDRPPKSSSEVSLGVVTERIFEGVTCFTPTVSNLSSPNRDMRIGKSEPIQKPSDKELELVIPLFGSLTTSAKDDDYIARILAPKSALTKVVDMVSDYDAPPSTRRHSSPLPSSSPEPSSVDIRPPTRAQEIARSAKHKEAVAKISQRLSNSSNVLTPEHFTQLIFSGAPARFHESSLELLYSTNSHGISLHTLYHRCQKRAPTVIAIRDMKGRVFGCYASQAWKATATRYYGSGESFVFGAEDQTHLQIFRWSRQNSYFQFTSGSFLAIGGGAGSHFALWIDEDLFMGTTSACATFENPPLTDVSSFDDKNTDEFKIVCLEVWAFVPRRIHSL